MKSQTKLYIGLVFFIFYVPVLHANKEQEVNKKTDTAKGGFFEHLHKGDYDRAIQIVTQDFGPTEVAEETQSLLKARIIQALKLADSMRIQSDHRGDKSILYRQHAISQYVLQQNDKSLEEYKSALERDPNSKDFDTLYQKAADIVNEQGKARLKAGELDKAYESFSLVLAFYPGFAKAYNNVGLIIMAQGRIAVIQWYHSDSESYTLLFRQAVQWYDRAILLDPTESAFYVNRGIAFSELKDVYRATKDFDKAISLDPLSISAYVNRGVFLSRQRQGELALADLNKALELLQKSPEKSLNQNNGELAHIYYNRAGVYSKLGQWELAIADYQSALRTPFFKPKGQLHCGF